MKTIIPFSGFYQSIHDEAIDRAYDDFFDIGRSTFEVSEERKEAMEELKDLCNVNFERVHNQYAEEFAKRFANKFDIAGLKFESLISPREYNFETDRIACVFPNQDFPVFMLRKIDREKLRKKIEEECTSRDGFISFYSNDLEEWPTEISDWKPAQLKLLIEVYIEAHEDYSEDWETEILEEMASNGEIDNLIYNNMENRRSMMAIRDCLMGEE